jgi:hypothetical protein
MSATLQPGVPGWIARERMAALQAQRAREAAGPVDYSCRHCGGIYTLEEVRHQEGDEAYCSADCRQAAGEGEPEAPEAGAEAAEEGGAPRCIGTTLAGEPCGMSRLKGSQFCYHHDPERRAAAPRELAERLARQEAEREAKAAARRRESWAAELGTPAQLRAFVAQVTRAAWDRRLGPEDAGVCLEGARLLADLFRAEGPRGGRP